MTLARTLIGTLLLGMMLPACGGGGGGGGGGIAPSGDPGQAGNNAPEALADRGTLPEDGTLALDVLANDQDSDGDVLRIESIGKAEHGEVTQDGDRLVYRPDADYHGDDRFEYTVTDDRPGGEATAEVRLTIEPVNDAPTANTDRATLREDSPATTIDVLANDTDRDGDALEITVVGDGELGTVEEIDGKLVYLPTRDANGVDEVRYEIRDPSGERSRSSVLVTIDAVNDAPVAQADQISLQEDHEQSLISALDNDIDIEDDAISFLSVSRPQNGRIEWRSTGKGDVPTYIPDGNFIGTESLVYKIRDSKGAESAEAAISLRVDAVTVAFDGQAEGGLYPSGGIAVADVDADGSADIATVSWEFSGTQLIPSHLSVYPRRGRTFSRETFELDQALQRLHFAPLDDGAPELLLSTVDPSATSLPVGYRNTSDSRSIGFDFRGETTFGSRGATHGQMVTADFDGDRRLDVAVTAKDAILVFINRSSRDGSYLFDRTQRFPVDGIVTDLIAADFDQDGKLDLATGRTSEAASHGIDVLFNVSAKGQIDFANPVSLATEFEAMHLATGDFDGDSYPDIAFAGLYTARVAVMLNVTPSSEFPTFGLLEDVFSGSGYPIWDLEAGDLDDDGYDDLAFAHLPQPGFCGETRLLVSNSRSDARLSFKPVIELQGDGLSVCQPTDLALADVDGDGRIDIAIADLTQHGFSLAWNETVR